MAAVTASSSAGLLTISGSALTASTVYNVVLSITGGAFSQRFRVTTDGSGAFTQVIPTPQSLQGATYNVAAYAASPSAESSVSGIHVTVASVSAAASTTFVVPTPLS